MTKDKMLATTIIYTIDPVALSYSNCDVAVFIELLSSKLGLSVKLPDVDMDRMNSLGMNTHEIDLIKIYSAIFKSEEPRISFRNGSFSENSSVDYTITQVVLSSENLAVEVKAETDVCEKVCSIVYDAFCSASELKSNWNSIQPYIAMKSFRTKTESFIGNNANKLLNPVVAEVLGDNLEGGLSFGSKMMARSKYDSFKPERDVVAIWNLNEINIRVSIFSKVTGRNEISTINMDVRAKDDIGRGVLVIQSEMPYEDHLAFTEALRHSLSEQS